MSDCIKYIRLSGVGGVGFGGQDGCERRIEANVKIQKKMGGGGPGVGFFFFGGGGGQDGCERRIEVFVKIKKKIFFFGGGGGGQSGSGGSGWGGGVRMVVNEELKFFVKIQ